MENKWYILYNGQQIGPMTKEQLLHYGLSPDSQVWKEGLPNWVPVYTIPELMSMLPPNYSSMSGSASTTGKSKVAAGLLAILLGYLGLQYFYCGKVAGEFICIILTICTCGLWSIISLVQGILMITMTDNEFENKYVLSPSTFPIF